jgi:acyl-CoA synthetase (NDP forming)
VVTADACASLGLEVPELDSDTVMSLREGMPPHAPPPRNPVDFAGSFRTTMEEAAVVEKLLSRDYIDGVISNAPLNPAVWAATLGFVGMPKPLLEMTKVAIEGADYFSSLPLKYGKPIITIRFRRFAHDMVIDILRGARIPVYDTPEECARAMHALVRYAEIRQRSVSRV